MADLIDRDATIKLFCDDCCKRRGVTEMCGDDEKCQDIDVLKSAPAVNRWIPCIERLPYICVDVIVYVRTWREQKVQFGFRYSEETWSVADIGVPNDEITFWMPLPEPPKDDET